MKIETTPRGDHQITMTVTLDLDQMESAKHRAARKISERKPLPGFRPGKAPYEVVLRTYGEAALREEAIDLLLGEIYPKALDEAKIEPGASGTLEKFEDINKTPRFIFIVPLAPKVNLGNYYSIRVPYTWKEPDEKEVEKSLEDLRQMYAKTEAVDRPVEYGDFVLVDITAETSNASKEDAPPVSRTGYPVFIRKDEKPDEWPFTGFSKKLLGSKINDVISFTHKFAEDHGDEVLNGKTLKFSIVIKMVRGSILPELNDEFAKKLGPFENVKALRDSVKANLASRSKIEYDDDYFIKVLEAVKTDTSILYAPQTLDHEVAHILEDIKTRLAKQGMDLPTYLKSREMDEEQYITKEVRPIAIKRLERSLLLDEISRAEKIEVSKEMLDNAFQSTYYEMSGSEDFQKYMRGRNQPPKQILNAVAMESANRAYLQQTLERLKVIATGQASDNTPIPPKEKNTKKGTSTKSSSKKSSSLEKAETTKKPKGNPKKLIR